MTVTLTATPANGSYITVNGNNIGAQSTGSAVTATYQVRNSDITLNLDGNNT